MKIIQKATMLFAVLLWASACNLDLNSSSTITIDDPKDAFKTYRDATRLANGLNAYFRSNLNGSFAEVTEAQADMFNITQASGNRLGGPHTMNANFTTGDYDIRGVWDGFYSSISNYNFFIDNINNVELSGNPDEQTKQIADMKKWKGNAFFYRAFSYQQLAKLFCVDYEPATAISDLGLPLITEFDIYAKPSRASLQDTYDFIQKDIDSARKYLVGVTGMANSITPTIDILDALEARVKLITHQWADAATIAGRVASSPTYVLSSTQDQINSVWFDDAGTEVMMQTFATMTESGPSNTIFIGGMAGWAGPDWAYIPDFLPTKTAIDLYEDGDIRTAAYFKDLIFFIAGQVDYTSFLAKFRGAADLRNTEYYISRCRAKPFRVAEMFLIKAEAEARQGLATAKATLNSLQSARKASLTDGSLTSVQTEWAKEMMGEGYRVECLKRWNLGFTDRVPVNTSIVFTGVGYTKITIDPGYYKLTWPIPNNDIQTNSNVKQNPGW